MTFGPGRNVYIACAIVILVWNANALARPQDKPAANPEIMDPYSAVPVAPSYSPPTSSGTIDMGKSDQAPETISPPGANDKPITTQDPIADSGNGETNSSSGMNDTAISGTTPQEPVVNYPRPEYLRESPTLLSQDENVIRNSAGEIIDIESYPDDTESVDGKSTTNRHALSYLDRRGSWGTLLSLGYSLYYPTEYIPNFGTGDQSYASYYGGSAPGMPELNIIIKKNFSAGSFGVGVKAGSFSVTGNGTTLTVLPIRVGGTYFMDALSKDPRFVPYIGGGVYTAIYNETLSGQTVNGNSPISYYYNVGIEMQLNWLDEYGSRYSYEDFGMENAFIFLEAEGLGSPSDDTSADLSNPLYVSLGFRMEF